MITITVNGETREVPEGLSIATLLQHFGIEPKMVVVELNGEIASRSEFQAARVDDGAKIEIVQMMAGG